MTLCDSLHTHRLTISSVASSLLCSFFFSSHIRLYWSLLVEVLCSFLMTLHFPTHTQLPNYCPVTEITSCHSLNKTSDVGWSSIALQSVKNTGALQRTLVPFLAPIWWLTSGFNSSSKGSIPLFWSPQTLHTRGALTYVHTKHHTYNIKTNSNILSLFSFLTSKPPRYTCVLRCTEPNFLLQLHIFSFYSLLRLCPSLKPNEPTAHSASDLPQIQGYFLSQPLGCCKLQFFTPEVFILLFFHLGKTIPQILSLSNVSPSL